MKIIDRRPALAVVAGIGVIAAVLFVVAFAIAGHARASDPEQTANAAVRTCVTDINGYCTVSPELNFVAREGVAIALTPMVAPGQTHYNLTLTAGKIYIDRFTVRATRTSGAAYARAKITFSFVGIEPQLIGTTRR